MRPWALIGGWLFALLFIAAPQADAGTANIGLTIDDRIGTDHLFRVSEGNSITIRVRGVVPADGAARMVTAATVSPPGNGNGISENDWLDTRNTRVMLPGTDYATPGSDYNVIINQTHIV